MDRPSVTMNIPRSSDPFVRWGEALLDRPATAVADLLSGRAALGTQQRAEPEDFLADLLAQPFWEERRIELTDRLDQALIEWLEGQIQWDLGRVRKYGTRAYVAELADGLAVAARLPLAHTARELIERQVVWDNRLSGLRWPGDIDLWRRFDLVLIQHQPDTRFAPRWFAACERAAWGNPLWRSDLTTGLLGLRKLPHPPDSVPERPVAAALARFAALASERGLSLPQVESAFRRGAGALAVLYPRRDQHWQDLWSEVLDDLRRDKTHQSMADRIASQWLSGVLPAKVTPVRTGKPTAAGRRAKQPTRHADLPAKHKSDALIGNMRHASRLDAALWTRIRGLMGHQWTYARATGDGYFAVRTLHNLATKLLRLAPDTGVLTTMHGWTLRALELEPENPFIWGLWARVLTALGESESALAVRWETVRRFPNDPVLRVELADLLRRRHQPAIAEHLLRETRRDFPRNEVCRNVLAELLRETNRPAEAEQVLRETMRDFPSDVVCRHALAFLLWRQDRRREAEAVLTEAESIAPNNPYVQKLGGIIRGESEPTEETLEEYRLPLPFYLKARTEAWAEISDWAADQEQPVPAGPVESARDEASWLARTVSAPGPVLGGTQSAAPTPTESILPSDGATEPPLRSFRDQLTKQAPLIQAYFSGGDLGLAGSARTLKQQAESGTSDLALVAAHRAGLLNGPEGRALLEGWVRLRPHSFPTRLLLAYDTAGGSMDLTALKDIRRDFPDRYAWIDPLRLAFQSRDERRDYLARLGRSRDERDRRLWDGRIEAIYPGLKGEDDRLASDPDALRRYVEDIALAQSERAIPSVAIA